MATASGTYQLPTDRYWALDEGKKVACYLARKRGEYFTFLNGCGLQNKIARNNRYFHGDFSRAATAPGDMAIRQNQETGNVHLAMNEFRALVSQLAILATENPPAWDTLARNSSHEALQQTILGNDILDYEMDGPHHVEEKLRDAVEDALIFTSGYVWTRWDRHCGDEVGAELYGFPEYDGDIRHSNPNFYQVLYPWDRPWRQKQWVCVWDYENIWDLIAVNPEKRDEILQSWKKRESYGPDGFQKIGAEAPDPDTVEVGYFYHLRTPALPYGRKIKFVAECILEDTYERPGSVWGGEEMDQASGYGPGEDYNEPSNTALVWSDLDQPEPEGWNLMLPVHRVIPARYLLTSFGYSIAFDLQGFQEALNGEISTILNNHKNFAQLRIWTHINDQMSIEPIDEGCTLIKSVTPPQSLKLLEPIPEAFQLITLLRGMGEAISGVNAVARGIPTDKATSGVALALIDQKAQQAASHLIAAYYQLLSDVGSATLEIYQRNASSPRTIAATAGNSRTTIKTFNADKLSLIQRVAVKAGNPLSRTLSGRFELAKFLAENNLVTNKEEILTVLNTGQYKPLMRAEMSELAIISEENERLSRGEAVRVSPMDNHALHLREQHAYLDSTELRQSEAGKYFVAHLEQHIDMLRIPKIVEMQLILGFQVPPILLQGLAGGGPPGAPGVPSEPPDGNAPGGGPMPPGMGAPAPLPPGLGVQGTPGAEPAKETPRLPQLPPAVAQNLQDARAKSRAVAALR